jgi:restriction system protein
MSAQPTIPAYDDLFEPTVQALRVLGGSGTIQEIYEKICELEGYSEEQQSVLHKEGPRTEIAYRLAWARTYLKNYIAIENSERGFWSLTEKGRNLQVIDKQDVKRAFKNKKVKDSLEPSSSESDVPIPIESTLWTEKLLTVLQKMSPDAFERLCQRILRASGFIKVQVTGRKGDGGIDGIGVLRIALLSFQVFFQCKRYSGSVGPGEIRDFRGAMVGRTDKGLFITTGTFTSEAKKEATRDGAPALDLIDGDQLCTILKDLKLGVETKTIEVVDIDELWFSHL